MLFAQDFPQNFPVAFETPFSANCEILKAIFQLRALSSDMRGRTSPEEENQPGVYFLLAQLMMIE